MRTTTENGGRGRLRRSGSPSNGAAGVATVARRPRPLAPDELSTPFQPVGVAPRYRGARATIDPDRSKSWLRRALPVVLAHKVIFITSPILIP